MKADRPLISLALPTMNGMPGLRRTVEALQCQTYRNFELVVQDSCSTDGSLEYLRSVDLPVISIVSEPDSGKGQAYNRAIRRCRGPIVVAAACDEWLEPNGLETYVGWYNSNPHVAFCYGGERLWSDPETVHSLYRPGRYELISFIRAEQTVTLAGFFNKPILGDAFHLDESLKTCPDYDLFIRLGLQFGPADIVEKPEIVLNKMIDRSSQTFRAEAFDQFARDRFDILDRFFLEQGDSQLLRYFRDTAIASMYCRLAAGLRSLTGESAQFRHLLLEAARHNPTWPMVSQLVAECKRLTRDPGSGAVRECDIDQPALPPAGAVPAPGVADLETVRSEPEWLAVGAGIVPEADAVSIRTGPGVWSEAARLRFAFPSDASINRWYWLELSATVRFGEIAFAIRSDQRDLRREQVVAADRSESRIVMAFSGRDAELVLRNASPFGASQVAIHWLKTFAMEPTTVEAYRRLLAGPSPDEKP